MDTIKPRVSFVPVSFVNNTNMSYHFPAEADLGTLQWSHYCYTSLPPEFQQPQHKVIISSKRL